MSYLNARAQRSAPRPRRSDERSDVAVAAGLLGALSSLELRGSFGTRAPP